MEILPDDPEAGVIALRSVRSARLDANSVQGVPPDIRVRFPLQIWIGF